jgi:transcriptional regulator GlxA family with amidase domain
MSEAASNDRKRVGIVVYEAADEIDVVGPHRVLGAAGFEVELVAEGNGPVRLSEGLRILPTCTLDDLPPVDVLIVPGGSSHSQITGRRVQQRNSRLLEFVRGVSSRAELTASVCTGAFVLAEAGLLSGRRVNTHWLFRHELKELMEERAEDLSIVPERVVWDGDLVSSGGVTSAIDLALSIVEQYEGREVRDRLEAMLERDTPPEPDAAQQNQKKTVQRASPEEKVGH